MVARFQSWWRRHPRITWGLVLALVAAGVIASVITAPGATVNLYPNSTTTASNNGWTCTNWDTYLDAADTANYAISTAANQVFLIAMDDPAASSGTINSITVYGSAMSGATSQRDGLQFAVNGVGNVYGGVASLTTRNAWQLCNSGAITTNPSTGAAWTWTDITNLQVGVMHTITGTQETINLDQLYVVVDYTPPTLTVTQGADAGRPSSKIIVGRSASSAVDEISLAAAGGNSTVTQVVVRGLDTVAALTTDVSGVRLFRDNGGTPGQWDGTDTQVGTTLRFLADASGSSVTFSGLSLAVASGSTEKLWVVYTIDPAAADGHILGSQVNVGDVTATGGAVTQGGNVVSANTGQTVQVDALAPAADATDPTDNTVLTGSSKTISGSASDAGSGVASVQVSIRRSDGQYWNGTGWTGTQTWNAAVGTTSWTYAWNLDASQNNGPFTYSITARATDNVGLVYSDVTPVTGVKVDNVAPTITSASAPDATHVDVLFSEALQSGSIAASDFTVAGLTVSAATLQPDGVTVRLTTSSQSGSGYTVSCAAGNVADVAGNTNALATANFTGFASASLTIAQGADSGRPMAKVFAGQSTSRTVDELALTAAGGSSTVTQIVVRGLDTVGALQTDVTGVRIFRDNGTTTGMWDASDTQVGTTQNFSGQASGSTVTFSGLALSVASGTTQKLWIVYTLGASAADGHVLGSQVNIGDVTATGGAVTQGANIVSAGSGQTIQIDATAPTANTTDPTDNSVLTDAIKTISGTASDGSGAGLSGVEVRIMRSDSKYWNGTGWSGTQTWNSASGTTSWTYAWSLDAGQNNGPLTYTITARAIDTVGLVGTDVTPVTGVKVDNIAPMAISASAVDATHVDVVFSEPLQSGSIAASDFTISGLTVSGAALQSGNTTVRLTTSNQSSGANYTVVCGDGNIADAAGNTNAVTTAGFTGSTVAADSEAPSAPATITATVGAASPVLATITWQAATDNIGVTAYRVYRSQTLTGTYVAIATVASSPYDDVSGYYAAGYYYKVTALDAAGNESEVSGPSGPAAPAWRNEPHTTFTPLTDNCKLCHSLHSPTYKMLVTTDGSTPDGVNVCYVCHDGTAADKNIKSGPSNSFALASGHSLEATTNSPDLTNMCSDCHEPHRDGSSFAGLPSKTINGATVTGSNNSWCEACHNDSNAWYVGAYPSVATPSRNASGYPVSGTYPGMSIYNDASRNAHSLIPSSTTAPRPGGSCLYCHSSHRGANEFDGLTLTYRPTTAATLFDDQANGTYAASCFYCHGGVIPSEVTTIPTNIKQFVIGNGSTEGHRIQTAGGKLPVGAQLPCYDCHNPHGSSRGNSRLITDELGKNLSTTGAADRHFCLSCHSTLDGKVWDSVSAAYVAVSTTETVEGLKRDGSDGSILKLPTRGGHASTDGQACEGCHGSDYGAGKSNVHNPSSGGESTGGESCFDCHSYQSMQSTTSYHHYMASDSAASYPTIADPSTLTPTDVRRTCLTCHVDHNIFNPTLNADAGHTGGRAQNLRASISVEPTKTNGATYLATDYDNTAANAGSVCVSCHSVRIAKNTTGRKTTADRFASTVKIPNADFAASAHNYGAFNGSSTTAGKTATFSADASNFSANCVKCHNDSLTKSYQSGPFKFGLHDANKASSVNAAAASPEDPQEEACWLCHSRSTDSAPSNPNGGSSYAASGSDYYGGGLQAGAMFPEALDVKGSFENPAIVSRHPVDGDGSTTARVECASCHNIHKTQPNLGMVENGVAQDPDNTFVGDYSFSPAYFSGATDLLIDAEKTQNRNYCLKCHDGSSPAKISSDGVYVPYDVFIPASDENTANPSDRPNKSRYIGRSHFNVTAADTSATAQTINEQCADCHDKHGSTLPALLGKASDVTGARDINGSVVTGNNNSVCFACHTGASAGMSFSASGYPLTGTWPSAATYNTPYNPVTHTGSIHATATAKWPGREGDYAGGDCKNCHDVHGTANDYDELRSENAAGLEGQYTFSPTNFSFCFNCHDTAPATDNIKSYYPTTAGGSATQSGTTRFGHKTQTAGNLPAGSALPCYDCHNPHGSASAYGLTVVTMTDGSTTITVGDAAGEINLGTDAGVRNFCFSCHTTSDTGAGWNGSGYSVVGAGAKVEGITRTGGVLKLPTHTEHAATGTKSCYTCHGNDYSGAGANNVHNPSGGVSSGGSDCYSCHATYGTNMEDGTGAKTGSARASSYHHVMGSATNDGDKAFAAGSYPTSTTDAYCLSCHVDHDKFNSAKGSNLRPDITTVNPAGASADYNSTTDSGVCTSCHATSLTKQVAGDQKSDGSVSTPKIVAGAAAAQYGASAHDYYATSSYDTSNFSANCVKCHNDEQTESFQTSTNKFGTHWSAERSIVSALGGALTDPVGETNCYGCHTGGTAGNDKYGVAAMTQAARSTQAQFALTSKHPVVATGGNSVECENCHNAHVVNSGTGKVTDPANTYNLASYDTTATKTTFCLKCHSGSGTLPTYTVNGTTYVPSTVTIAAADLAKMTQSTYAARGHWSQSGAIGAGEEVGCANCHDNHGSNVAKLLGVYDPASNTNKINGTTITANDNTVCAACHTAATGVTYSRVTSGYPNVGTWPGTTVYNGANGIHKGATVIWPGSTYAGGDCKNCHDVHGTANTYDELVGTFAANNFTLCFNCHDGAPSSFNIKQYYPTTNGGTATQLATTNFGHKIQTPTGNLAAGDGLPCYDCHGVHGSAETTALAVQTVNNNVTYAMGDVATEIDMTSVGGRRQFCFLCHSTGDATAQGTDYTDGIGYVNITTGGTSMFEGIDRTVYDVANKRGLKLPPVTGHYAADTTMDCYTCHGSDYSGAASINVHNPGPGVSTGLQDCYLCHGTYGDNMEDGTGAKTGSARASSYHHVMGSATNDGDKAFAAGSYPNSTTDLYCLSCHVDHDKFNSAKGSNLRPDITTVNPAGAAVDYNSTTDSGVCTSCHATSLTKQPAGDQKNDGTTTTPKIVAGAGAAQYGASAHDYYATSSYDTSNFSANCVKCHNDEQSKSFQTSTNKFGTHWSAERNLLSALGGTLTDPVGETNCYGCHTGGTAGNDKYGVAAMTQAARSTQAQFALTSKHPVVATGGNSVECESCHNAHVVNTTTGKVTDPANTYNIAPFATDADKVTYCLKCHSGSGTLPTYTVNGTTYVPSTVTIAAADLTKMTQSTYAARGHWSQSGAIGAGEEVNCAECHDNHGSNVAKLLGAYDPATATNKINGTTITANDNTVCAACHTAATGTAYTRLSNGYPNVGTWPGTTVYNGATGIHKGATVIWPGSTYTGGDCKNCHDVHGTANTYDELVGSFSPTSTANDRYAMCFNCHDGTVGSPSPAVSNIKQYYPTADGGTSSGSNAGHQIKTAGGNLSVGQGMPCYDCHAVHGSAELDGLQVESMIGGTKYILGDVGTEIDMSTAGGVRLFCFSCHVTATGRGTSSTGTTYANILATDLVEGIPRNPAVDNNALKLSALAAHTEADTRSCLTCHGGLTASSATNVHSPSSGAGGGPCNQSGCHGSDSTERLDKMQADNTTYHHVLDGATPFQNTYPTASTNTLYCLSCHVDHANFNTSGGNLRTSYNDAPTGASGSNSDFPGGGTYGVCISCHSVAQTKNNTGQKVGGSAQTPAISGANYDASAHDYLINDATKVGYGTDAFRANCLKCHDDGATSPSVRQTGTFKLATHYSAEKRIAYALGAALVGTSEQTEENLCFTCHITAGASATDIKAVAGRDAYDVTAMSADSEDIYDEFQKTYTHPITATSGLHKDDEGTTSNWNPAASRHVECEDCHNPHEAKAGVTAVPTTGADRGNTAPAIAGANTGVWGVGLNGSLWNWTGLASPNPADAVFPTYTRLATAGYQWQLCLKCHSTYAWGTSPPTVSMNLAGQTGGKETDVGEDFSPTQLAYHPLFAVGKNQPTAITWWDTGNKGSYIPGRKGAAGLSLTNTMVDGWTMTSIVVCTDCHNNETAGGSSGPHGSNNRWLLKGLDPNGKITYQTTKGTFTTDNSTVLGTSLATNASNMCLNCHRTDVYGGIGIAGGTYSTLSRFDHKTFQTACINMANLNSVLQWSNCLGCHGGRKDANSYGGKTSAAAPVQSGAIHGTSLTYHPSAATFTGATNYMGQRFLNGANWSQHKLDKTTVTGSVGCYNFTSGGTFDAAVDTYSDCVHHTGDTYNANYAY